MIWMMLLHPYWIVLKMNSNYDMTKGYYYISKNYRSNSSAAGKAKIDCEEILKNAGYKNLGLKQSVHPGTIYGFFRNLITVFIACLRLKSKSILVLQYPLKKYYPFLCYWANLKQCKVITLIHDLRSHRQGKISVQKEIRQLNRSHILIVHNKSMQKWLEENHIRCHIICLEIFDYLSDTEHCQHPIHKPYELVFAGVLSNKKNSFIYKIPPETQHYRLNIYGPGADHTEIKNNPVLHYEGYYNADVLISKIKGNFGLVWDGDEICTCSGNYGEYLKFNNPHKTSLYIRCHLPVIVWSKAAIADFVRQNGIGIVVNSLEELDHKLAYLTEKEYQEMLSHTDMISKQLKTGFYLRQALQKCEKILVSE